ncbi:MAG: ABC transporter ATP-binding protein [SAR324 cluster bacterium]|jgi:peptide/nickel transport system ATP-binding protein|nr:ABC transporter ATP-binding protein [SAR324 cluster bacterium]
MEEKNILEIQKATKIYNIGTSFFAGKNELVALNEFNLKIPESPASITTIAGESGSGKTTIANLILGFIELTSGNIRFGGKDINMMSKEEKINYRRNIQAVFQDPFGVYNPFYRISHIFEIVIKHFKITSNKNDARELIEKSLNVVGLRGEEVLEKYPHQLSGGQRQRMMMARVHLIRPKIIVADEPVSMVDASLRAAILDVMLKLRDEDGISFIYITHDLSTAYQVGDNIIILYKGKVVETGKATNVIDNPTHPYVKLLIDSIPVPDPDHKWTEMIDIPDEGMDFKDH